MKMKSSRIICLCIILCFSIYAILFDIFKLADSYLKSALYVKYKNLLWLKLDDHLRTINRISSPPGNTSTPLSNDFINITSYQFPTLTSDDIPLHTFSAISKLNLTTNGYNSILVNVWHRSRSTKYRCCFRTEQNIYFERRAVVIQYFPNYSKVYGCNLLDSDVMPFEVALLNNYSSYSCNNIKNFTTIIYPKRHDNELALCVKAAYGHLEIKDLIAWVEFHLMVGVDMIFFLVNKIDNKDALDKLRFYSQKGVLQIVDYKFHLPLTVETKACYQRLSTYDCQERMRGYTYAGLLDIDEYIVPQKSISIKEVIKSKLTDNKAAGVTFLANYFFKSWKTKKPSSRIDSLYYFQTTVPYGVRVKSIHIPERTKFMSVNLHLYKALPGYSRKVRPDGLEGVSVNPQLAAIHHYRSCPNDRRFGDCTNVTRLVNERMLDFADKLSYRIDRSLNEMRYHSNEDT